MAERGPKRIVALSDVHIGDDGPTCWYQSSVHEPYLIAILDWVVAHADDVDELVLLGDVVDLWTYPFSQRPPTFTDIVHANPAIFAPTGALGRVLDALEGAVTWVPGNHDMGIDPAEAAQVVGLQGHSLQLLTDLEYRPHPRVLMSHGHANTMFNAMDPNSPWSVGLPAGHFVTRAVAQHWHKRLEPGQTVADLPGQGAPNGISLEGITRAAGGVGSMSVVGALFDLLSGTLEVSEADPIQMEDGTVATLAEARDVYSALWSTWVELHGGGKQGEIEALRAAYGDGVEKLGWFAQADAFDADADLVVMGHTHGAVRDLENSIVSYVNTGFECPSAPDLKAGAEMTNPETTSTPSNRSRITFGVIDVANDLPTGAVHEAVDVDGAIVCRPTSAPTESLEVLGTMDFSTYIEIDNRFSGHDLVLVDADASDGRFVRPPRQTIAEGTVSRIWIQDQLGLSGSSGSVRYQRAGKPDLIIAAACPTGLSSNQCEATARFISRSGDGDWGSQDEVPHWGHPLFVRVDAATVASTTDELEATAVAEKRDRSGRWMVLVGVALAALAAVRWVTRPNRASVGDCNSTAGAGRSRD